jgi:hypothetical protein
MVFLFVSFLFIPHQNPLPCLTRLVSIILIIRGEEYKLLVWSLATEIHSHISIRNFILHLLGTWRHYNVSVSRTQPGTSHSQHRTPKRWQGWKSRWQGRGIDARPLSPANWMPQICCDGTSNIMYSFGWYVQWLAYGLDDREIWVWFLEERRNFSLLLVFTQTSSLQLIGSVFIPWDQNGRGVKMVVLFHLVPRLRMPGALPLLPYTPIFRGVYE